MPSKSKSEYVLNVQSGDVIVATKVRRGSQRAPLSSNCQNRLTATGMKYQNTEAKGANAKTRTQKIRVQSSEGLIRLLVREALIKLFLFDSDGGSGGGLARSTFHQLSNFFVGQNF